jgi:hypothetical protein
MGQMPPQTTAAAGQFQYDLDRDRLPLGQRAEDAAARVYRGAKQYTGTTASRTAQGRNPAKGCADRSPTAILLSCDDRISAVDASHSARDLGEGHLMTRRQALAAGVSLAVLLGGIALATIALPFWRTFEERAAEAALRKLGASISDDKFGGRSVELPTQISDETLTKEKPHLEKLNIARLSLPHAKLTTLEPLKGLTNLSSLDLNDAIGITSLEPLKGLTELRSLDLSYTTAVTSLEPLKGLTNLSLLNLRNATGITSLEPLKELTKLSSLNLNSATGITSLEPLKGLINLIWLDLTNATGITSLEPLKGLTYLGNLNLNSATRITSLEPLKGLRNLSSLDLSDTVGITSLEPLKELTELRSLTLINDAGITSLEPLKGLRNLDTLYLNDAKGIKTLEPLKELGVQIYGASDELLATMN